MKVVVLVKGRLIIPKLQQGFLVLVLAAYRNSNAETKPFFSYNEKKFQRTELSIQPIMTDCKLEVSAETKF